MELSVFDVTHVGTCVPKPKGIRKCIIEYSKVYDKADKRSPSVLLFKDVQTGNWHVRTESLGPEGHTYRLADIYMIGQTYSTLRTVAFSRNLEVYQVVEKDNKKRRDLIKALKGKYSQKIIS